MSSSNSVEEQMAALKTEIREIVEENKDLLNSTPVKLSDAWEYVDKVYFSLFYKKFENILEDKKELLECEDTIKNDRLPIGVAKKILSALRDDTIANINCLEKSVIDLLETELQKAGSSEEPDIPYYIYYQSLELLEERILKVKRNIRIAIPDLMSKMKRCNSEILRWIEELEQIF